MKKIKKYYEYFITKIVRKIKEKKFNFDNTCLKYILEEGKTDSLIVVFSACTRKGIKGRYNYMKTLNTIKTNKLYILDDFAEDKRGCYYLGESLSRNVEDACVALIKKICFEKNIKKIICVGSSKGGYAALNIMLNLSNADCIIGAPQYLLGDYLMNPKLEICRKYVMNKCNSDEINYLNNYLKNKIVKNKEKHNIFIQFSDIEHTYNEHIKYLIDDLTKNKKIILHKSVEKFTDHSEISTYFPSYLVEVLKKVI